MDIAYFEDIVVGHKSTVGTYVAQKEEMIEFARKWDPRPFHVDEEAAAAHPSQGIIASSSYLMSVMTMLTALYENPMPMSLGLLEYEKLEIPTPARPGDSLTITVERLAKQESRTRPDRGVVRSLVEMRNQTNEVVLRFISQSIVAKRPV